MATPENRARVGLLDRLMQVTPEQRGQAISVLARGLPMLVRTGLIPLIRATQPVVPQGDSLLAKLQAAAQGRVQRFSKTFNRMDPMTAAANTLAAGGYQHGPYIGVDPVTGSAYHAGNIPASVSEPPPPVATDTPPAPTPVAFGHGPQGATFYPVGTPGVNFLNPVTGVPQTLLPYPPGPQAFQPDPRRLLFR